jgi:hypothetical protein
MDASSSTPLPFLGTQRFRPVEILGRGSMGRVFKVYDNEIGIAVALKTLQDTAPEQVYRLKQEFRGLAGVVHPNLVQLFELLIEPDLQCFTMEYIEGSDFITYARPGMPPGPDALPRFLDGSTQLLCGLRALHAAGRLHRDVKPSNIRVESSGRVVLLDFDLSIAVGRDGQSVLPSAAAGTFAYMPPETLHGTPLGPPADLYSVGVIFYEVLYGCVPYKHPLLLTGAQPPVPLRQRAPWVPARLEEITLRLLAREPERRPSLEEVLSRLRRELPSAPVVDRFVRGRDEFLGGDAEMAQLAASCAVPPLEGLLIDPDVLHVEAAAAVQAARDGTALDSPDCVPAEAQLARHRGHRRLLQPVDHEPFEQHRELRATRRPRHGHLQDPVRRAVDPRHPRMEPRLELTSVEVPPLARAVIVDGPRCPTLRTLGRRALRPTQPHVDGRALEINLDPLDRPRRLQPQNRRVEFPVPHPPLLSPLGDGRIARREPASRQPVTRPTRNPEEPVWNWILLGACGLRCLCRRTVYHGRKAKSSVAVKCSATHATRGRCRLDAVRRKRGG